MEFSVSLFQNTQQVPLSFQETIAIPLVYGLCEDCLTLEFSGCVIKTPEADSYTLNGLLKTILPMNCDKCLERVDIPLRLEVNEHFIRKGSTISGDAVSEKLLPSRIQLPEEFSNFDGESIDFTQALKVLVYLNIPPRVVCGEDCKGLCPQCGYNFNQGDCDCERVIIDSRFLVLHSFFKDKEV